MLTHSRRLLPRGCDLMPGARAGYPTRPQTRIEELALIDAAVLGAPTSGDR